MLLKRANAPLAVLRPPVVLLKSAPAPVAVFWSAVFRRRAPAPTPVLKAAGGDCLVSEKPTCCVVTASGETEERALSFGRVAARIAAVGGRSDGLHLW